MLPLVLIFSTSSGKAMNDKTMLWKCVIWSLRLHLLEAQCFVWGILALCSDRWPLANNTISLVYSAVELNLCTGHLQKYCIIRAYAKSGRYNLPVLVNLKMTRGKDESEDWESYSDINHGSHLHSHLMPLGQIQCYLMWAKPLRGIKMQTLNCVVPCISPFTALISCHLSIVWSIKAWKCL